MQISTLIERPQRWDSPFGENMTEADVQALLKIEPFRSMDAKTFPQNTPLDGVLKNDCRIVEFQDKDIIIREGDYGHTAFLVLSGEVLISLKKLPAKLLGRPQTRKKTFFETVAQLWNNHGIAERRDYNQAGLSKDASLQPDRIFLQDIPGVLDNDRTVTLGKGEVFGELAALTRSERSATVLSHGGCRLLEIRWQGLRELLKRAPALRNHIDGLYRQNSLRVHFRQTPLLQRVPTAGLDELVEKTEFETFGNFDWNHKFKSLQKQDVANRIESEPLIVKEGEYVNGLYLIRNGFARVSRRQGSGHQTLEYLGKGHVFGLPELAHNWRSDQPVGWQQSLRAVGYVDILRIPTALVEKFILPSLSVDELPETLGRQNDQPDEETIVPDTHSDRQLEFMVENRFMNGTQAMVIDLDRCTRCDDCIRACAATHDNNPRFSRQGQRFDQYMIANACMHCSDPVCMIGCPTGAIGRDATTGNVTINDNTCIGCSTCANSCPYQNIRMVSINDKHGNPIVDSNNNEPIVKATKCDLCVQERGGPACQRACPHDALVRIDLTKPASLSKWGSTRKT